MTQVKKYSVLFYSGENGYLNNRVQIEVRDSAGNTIGWIRFKDPGMPYELDTNDNGIITMHLPSAMFPSVLDAIRNEKTDLYYQIGGGLPDFGQKLVRIVSGRQRGALRPPPSRVVPCERMGSER